MTEDHKKENLSCRCIESFANYLGYDVEKVSNDFGVDLRIVEYACRTNADGKKSYLPSNRDLKVQVKATTEKGIRREKGKLKYNLRVKNFNDMVEHQQWQRPTFLFLVILPDDESKWLSHDIEYLTLHRQCFWYIHPEGTKITENEHTCVIEIPDDQYISENTINDLLNSSYN